MGVIIVNRSTTYASAGVDIAASNLTKERIKPIIRGTFGPEVVRDVGSFGGLFAPNWHDYDDPVLVASTDSVGTKLKVAFMMGRHDTVGIDIVAHCANDIVVQGAKPLFFLDYIAMGRHDPEVVVALITGLAEGCQQVGCALLGGETAELPELYKEGEYDLAGTIIGGVDRAGIIDGSHIRKGDIILGLASDGLHTNGYSFARKLLFTVAGLGVDTYVEALNRTVGEELLRPHRCYVRSLLALLNRSVDVHGMAHVTGGGLINNLPRILPAGTAACIRRKSWEVPPIFPLLREIGRVDEREMFKAFNMGIGMTVIVPQEMVDRAIPSLVEKGEWVFVIGEIVAGERDVRFVE
ncbi:MAG: phosphoribosylformylglycinamidine cyclo-ligase [Candidatus Latescibacteria bacterium]|nr:phosphoribosylformylglycinamidine cyclo-ligase [Candidatus Latescibacterota bacterium]